MLMRNDTRRQTGERLARRPGDVTIRRASQDDAEAVRRLAALGGSIMKSGDVLVAEVAGELWAAITIDGSGAVADPFRPTAELVSLLWARPAQIRAAGAEPATPVRRMIPLLGGR